MRISKTYDVRRREIIDTAQTLFQQNGYEQTSVDLIVETVGISKGTFYHYFKSKDLLLQAISQTFVDAAKLQIEAILATDDLDAVQKMNRIFADQSQYNAERKPLVLAVFKYVYRKENTRVRQTMLDEDAAMLSPLIARVIEQGVREGVFSCLDSLDTADMLIRIMYALDEVVAKLMFELETRPENAALIDRKRELFERTYERILGADDGALSIYNRNWREYFNIT